MAGAAAHCRRLCNRGQIWCHTHLCVSSQPPRTTCGEIQAARQQGQPERTRVCVQSAARRAGDSHVWAVAYHFEESRRTPKLPTLFISKNLMNNEKMNLERLRDLPVARPGWTPAGVPRKTPKTYHLIHGKTDLAERIGTEEVGIAIALSAPRFLHCAVLTRRAGASSGLQQVRPATY